MCVAIVDFILAPGSEEESASGEVLDSRMCSMEESILKMKQEFAIIWQQEVEQISISFQGIYPVIVDTFINKLIFK